MVDPAQNTKHLMAALENCPLIPVLTISQNDLIDPLSLVAHNDMDLLSEFEMLMEL